MVVVGASANPQRIGGRALHYLKEYGYSGRVYGVNPKYQEVQGFSCFPDVESLPEAVDLAVLFVSSRQVLSIVQACATRGIRAVIVTAAGFAESGPEGLELQERLGEIARNSSMRILGPNTLGFRDQEEGIFATFATDLDSGLRKGRLAVITQSGGLGGYFGAALPREHGVGTRYLIDTGNEVDIEVAECIEHVSRDESVSAIGVILEGCRDGRRFLRACLVAQQLGKPVVVLKIGRTQEGARAVQLHTGALAGEDKVWDAALAAAGAIRAHDEAQFFELLCLLDTERRPLGRGIGILTLSGGVATLLIDACSQFGLEVPELSAPEQELLDALPLVGFHNPLDASGQMANTPEAIGTLLSVMVRQEEIDFVVVWLAYALLSPQVGPVMATALRTAVASAKKPVYILGLATPEIRDSLQAAGALVFTYPSRLMEAIAATLDSGRASLKELPSQQASQHFNSTLILTGLAAQEALAGLPFAVMEAVTSAGNAIATVKKLNCPVVMKVEAKDLIHKSDLDLVRLRVDSAEAVGACYDELAEAMVRYGLEGSVIVQQQIDGVEAYVGYKVDRVFGPTVMVGIGGIFIEQLQDVITLLAPVTPDQVLSALPRLKGYPLLRGARGRQKADVEALSRAVATLSELAAAQPQIREVDLNPIIVRSEGQGAFVVDAVVRIQS